MQFKKNKKREDLVKLVKFQTCTEISDVENCKRRINNIGDIKKKSTYY